MEDRLIKKLNDLSNELPFTKESQVVYFFVETRKFLDKKDYTGEYVYVRFFCDWVVHTEKTQKLNVVREDFEKIAKDLELQEKKSVVELIMDENERPIDQFVDFIRLREQIADFFNKEDISRNFVNNDQNWYSLRNLLFRILADQKIDFGDKPVKNIKSLCFREVRKELYGCLLDIEFVKNSKPEKRSFIFANDEPNFRICKY